jgi:hypothetical protein
MHMLTIIGVILNLGLVIYMGFQLSKCQGTEQTAGLNTAQNHLMTSFVAVAAVFIALKN